MLYEVITLCSLFIPINRDCFSQSITWQRVYKNPIINGDDEAFDLCVITSYSIHYTKLYDEITNSVLHSYVNKQHLGFLGHSYLCEWVNLGAGTTTSNLKNNYSNIILNSGGGKIDTNSIFLGSIIGDRNNFV